jgi:formylglycine-generating enzyme required for sulfatase activity
MRMKPGWLGLRGYRLATEAEWEYGCRAGAVTSRYFGETEELLDRYAWYTKQSQDRNMQPTGNLRPNDFGLFDMLGNSVEYCHSAEQAYPSGASGVVPDLEDDKDLKDIPNDRLRVMLGGAFRDKAYLVRCAKRELATPLSGMYQGIRIAWTYR